MTAMERVRSQAELVAGLRDGSRTDFERFDPEDWKGERAKHAPKELFYKQTSGEVSVQPKDMAKQLIGLIDHVTEIQGILDSLLNAMPTDTPAAKVLMGAIRGNVRYLTEKPE